MKKPACWIEAVAAVAIPLVPTLAFNSSKKFWNRKSRTSLGRSAHYDGVRVEKGAAHEGTAPLQHRRTLASYFVWTTIEPRVIGWLKPLS